MNFRRGVLMFGVLSVIRSGAFCHQRELIRYSGFQGSLWHNGQTHVIGVCKLTTNLE